MNTYQNIDNLIQQIIQLPQFLKLKEVVENNAYHQHESVYDHSIKTLHIAQQQIQGEFIQNAKAKESFIHFVNQEIAGFKRKDCMILTALLHDIGKILRVKDGSSVKPLIVTLPDGTTVCPGHEYWGSTILKEILQHLSLPNQVIDSITSVIRLHDTFSEFYFSSKQSWQWEIVLNDIKSRAETFYIQTLFNMYCDTFTADVFRQGKTMIIKAFNDPLLYSMRQYSF